MPLSRSLVLTLLLAAAATGCASGEAFVDRNYMARSVHKQKLPGYSGSVNVCYDDEAPREKRDQLANEACAVYGLKALLSLETRLQCRLTVPNLANYRCIDPEMRFANGGYVNPFIPSQVEQWNRERKSKKKDTPKDPPVAEKNSGGS